MSRIALINSYSGGQPSYGWEGGLHKQSAKATDIQRLSDWNQKAVTVQFSFEEPLNELRFILGDIFKHLNRISFLFKEASRRFKPQIAAEARELLPDIDNIDGLRGVAENTTTILKKWTDQYSRISGSRATELHRVLMSVTGMTHSIMLANFTPEQKQRFRQIVAANAGTPNQFADEVDPSALAAFLQSAIYSIKDHSGRILKVVREALQNAVDAAVKRAQTQKGHLPSVEIDSVSYIQDGKKFLDLIIKDNGVGMDWNVLAQKFFVYFESGKRDDPNNPTGGFGIAKAILQETPQEGWSIDTNATHSSRFHKNVYTGVPVGSYQPPRSSLQPLPTGGTILSLYRLPLENDSGLTDYYIKQICCKYATSGNLRILYNGQIAEPEFNLSSLMSLGNGFTGLVDAVTENPAEKQMAQQIIAKESNAESLAGVLSFESGETETSISFFVRPTKGTYNNMFVFMNNQYQYDEGAGLVKAELICSIHTNAKPGSDEYPMTPGRDALREPYKDAVERIRVRVRDILRKIGESDLFKNGLNVQIFNKDKPPASTHGMEDEDAKYMRELYQRAFGGLHQAFPEQPDPDSPTPLDPKAETTAEDFAQKIQQETAGLHLNAEQVNIVSKITETMMAKKNDKINIHKEINRVIEAITTPCAIMIQKNFVSADNAFKDVTLTTNLTVLWMSILKILMRRIGKTLGYSKDYAPGIIFSDEALALFTPQGKSGNDNYSVISINPMAVAGLIDPELFDEFITKEIRAGKSWDAENKVMQLRQTPNIDESTANRVANFLMHSAIHELTHLLHPDSYGSDNFHNYVSTYEEMCHFQYKEIYNETKEFAAGIRTDSRRLIRMVGKDRLKRGVV